MSGILASLLSNRLVSDLVPGPGGDRLVVFTVRGLQALGLTVELAPTDDDPAHMHIVGEKNRSTRRDLADIAEYVV